MLCEVDGIQRLYQAFDQRNATQRWWPDPTSLQKGAIRG